jgi:hypothetical protein
MGLLIFCQLEGRRSDVCGLIVYHHCSSLSSGDIELAGGHIGLISIKRAYIDMLVRAGMDHMFKSPIV